MITIDEYIKKRKEEDNLNEFDLKSKSENIKNTVNYVFEYYNGYLDLTELEYQEAKESVKLANYRKKFLNYNRATQDWLVKTYSETGKYAHKYIENQLKEEPTLFLLDSDSEFRKISYDCYAALVKKIPFIKGNTEEVFEYIKEYKEVNTNELDFTFYEYGRVPQLVSWIESTYKKYNINLIKFAEEWCNYFCDSEHLWDRKTKSDHGQHSFYFYDFKNSKIFFNVGSLYTRMNYKPFIKGKRKELQTLILLTWFKTIASDDGNYIDDFISKNYTKEEIKEN